MSADCLADAVNLLAEQAPQLETRWRLPWPNVVQQTVHRLRYDAAEPDASSLPLVAVVGGASSGKSTVFNNLLGGRLVSRVTAKGHATRGVILALHETHRLRMERLLETGCLFPDCRATWVEGEAESCGEPDVLTLVAHRIDTLRDVLLLDTPDFTSEASLREGDVALTWLPWFDALLVVIDHERWFDHQSVSELRARSAPYDQRRFVLFNRTIEEPITDETATRLRRQAERLAAEGMTVLEFRRGRGFRAFPPGTLDAAVAFLRQPARDRTETLRRVVGRQARQVLNRHLERSERWDALESSLRDVIVRSAPSDRDCLLALMTARERRQLETIWRMFRASSPAEWLLQQTARLRGAIKRLAGWGAETNADQATNDAESDHSLQRREAVAWSFYQSAIRALTADIQRTVRQSSFWSEVEAWTGLTPPMPESAPTAAERAAVRDVVERFDAALNAWNAKVEQECRGAAPHATAGVTVGLLGLAVVLIALPGSVTALTLAAAKGAIAGAFAQLTAASGAAALFGKPLGRLVHVAHEKLLGAEEFNAVRDAARGFSRLLETASRRRKEETLTAARALILPPNTALLQALEQLANDSEKGK